MSQTLPPAGWYADPSQQHASRYWDGAQWTEHTSENPPPPPAQAQPVQQQPVQQQPAQQSPGWGQAGYSPAPAVQTNYTPDRIQRQIHQQAGVAPVAGGGGSLFNEPVLVVNQKTKIIELTNEYAVFNQAGVQIGSVVEVGQGAIKKAVRLVSSLDQYFTHRLEARDAGGAVQLVLTRPAKILKSKVVVSRPDGMEIGTIAQENAFGKIRFGLLVAGAKIGTIKAENWRAWNFSIVDHTDTEVARVTKTWEGLARTMFTSADNYVVQIHRHLDDPLRSLVVASALTIDTALKQDNRGLN